MDFRNEETVKSAFEDGILCRGLDKYSLTFAECVDIFTSHGIVMLEGFVHGSTTIPLSIVFRKTAFCMEWLIQTA